uniref:Uncharacterized protein n=1 Tax=Arundo donax TaxID=35708 RepID=A0A0A9BY35_ARUDO
MKYIHSYIHERITKGGQSVPYGYLSCDKITVQYH